MNKTTSGTLLVLEANLFPDAATLQSAFLKAPGKEKIQRSEVAPGKMDDAAWDRLLADILAAEIVLTL